MKRLICMAFDGDYQIERAEFDSIDKAWEHSNDIGSKWFFYPFHFVTSATGKTVKDAPEPLKHLIGWRVKRVAKIFERFAATPEAQGMEPEEFAFALPL